MTATPDWVEVYRSSAYAWMEGGSWSCVALDGDQAPPGRARSLSLITAWNPDSVERPLAANEAANARLLRALVGARQPWLPAFGASLPGVEPAWREEGFAVLDWDRDEACRWGREWGQRAVVWLGDGVTELLFCSEGRAVACRLRTLDAPLRVLPLDFPA